MPYKEGRWVFMVWENMRVFGIDNVPYPSQTGYNVRKSEKEGYEFARSPKCVIFRSVLHGLSEDNCTNKYCPVIFSHLLAIHQLGQHVDITSA